MLLSLDEKAEMLSDFGLTHNQAKVYIAIAQLGLASVSQALQKRPMCVEKTSTE